MKALILSFILFAGSVSFAEAVTEDQIPLATSEAAIKAVEPSSSSKVLLGIGLFAGFCILALFAFKKYKHKDLKAQQFQMKVLSQFHLSPRKSLAVVQVAGESILLGVTDHHISMIKSLSLMDEDFDGDVPKNFESVFSGNKQKDAEPEPESYSMQRIQDVVSNKIKSMRSL